MAKLRNGSKGLFELRHRGENENVQASKQQQRVIRNGAPWRERKCPSFETAAKVYSNWGAVERTKMSKLRNSSKGLFELGRRGENEYVQASKRRKGLFEPGHRGDNEKDQASKRKQRVIRTGAPWRERKCPSFETAAKGYSKWGAVERTKMSKLRNGSKGLFEMGRRGENEIVQASKRQQRVIRTGVPWRELKCPSFETAAKGYSNWGAVERTNMSKLRNSSKGLFELGRRGENEHVQASKRRQRVIRTGAPWRERKCPNFETAAKGYSNWGAVERTKMSKLQISGKGLFELGCRGENEYVQVRCFTSELPRSLICRRYCDSCREPRKLREAPESYKKHGQNT